MDKNSNALLWIAGGIFAFMVIMFVVVPSLKTVTTNETKKFEIITNGGDLTPPAGWTP